jgi:hypothetical protein
MDMLAEPLLILSIFIGTLSIIERILKRTTKYNKLLDKIRHSKNKLIELSNRSLLIDNGSEDELVLNAMGFIDNIVDYADIDFKIPD